MPSARFNSSAILGIALISVAIGVGFGFILAPTAPPPIVAAAAPLQPMGSSPITTGGSLAESPRLHVPADREAAGLSAAPKTEVSAARLNDAKTRIDLPRTSLSTTGFGGDGVISGAVFDDRGAPVSNITIIARRSDLGTASGRSTDHIGAAAPPVDSLDEALQQAAKAWAEDRDKQARVSTDTKGRFQLSGLTNGRYEVNAYKAGWTFSTVGQGQCYPGDVLTFRAAQVTPLQLVVKLPDGSIAEDALVECRFGNDTQLSSWTPEEPTLRLSMPRLQIKVFAGLLQTRMTQRKTMSRYASDYITVDAEDLAGSPLEVLVEARPGIRGSLDKEWDGESESYVMIATLENESDFNSDGPFKNRSAQSVAAGDFLFLDLEEGLYVIGVQANNSSTQELLNHQFVQVTNAIVEVDLNVPSPEISDYVLVHCLDPKGQPLNGVSLSVVTREGGNTRTRSVGSMQDADGTYWARKSRMRVADYDAWDPGVTIELLGKSLLYGTQSQALSSGQAEAHLQFTSPVSLTVSILGYEDLSYKSQLSIELTEQSTDGQYPTVIAKTRSINRRGSDPTLSRDGVVTFPSLAPGAYEVRLIKGGGSWSGGDPISTAPVMLGATDSSAQLIPPLLHDLVVYAPGLPDNAYLSLTPGSAGDGNSFSNIGSSYGRSSGGSSARLDSEKRAVFKDLQPGIYTLQKGWDGEGQEVSVPSGDIVFEPKLPNVLRVAITDDKGSLFAAGFRTGDAILSINGIAIVNKGLEDGAFGNFQADSSQVSLRRNGAVITVTIGKITGQSWDAKSIGGVLVPDFE